MGTSAEKCHRVNDATLRSEQARFDATASQQQRPGFEQVAKEKEKEGLAALFSMNVGTVRTWLKKVCVCSI